MARSLPELPQLQELLHHPKVQKALERVNRSTVAQHAVSFLSDLRAGAARAVGSVPTNVGDLAEAFVRRVLGTHQPDAPVVNATGVVLGEAWPAVPLAESAAHCLMLAASEFVASTGDLLQRVEHEAASLTGAEAALVFSSREALMMVVEEVGGVAFEDARIAGLVDPVEYGLASVPTVAARLTAGAEAVAIDGAGLLGGPRCGLLFGRRDTLERLRMSRLYGIAKPEPLTAEALLATLEAYRSDDGPQHKVPVLMMLSTPVDNLRQRAERLAPLIAAAGTLPRAEPVEDTSPWCSVPGLQLEGPTWSIHLSPPSQGAEDLIRRLRIGFGVAARQAGEAVRLDLRSVAPRWDQKLVEACEGLPV